MYRFGQLSILGIKVSTDLLDPDDQEFLLSDELFTRFESYHELVYRRPLIVPDPQRCYDLVLNTAPGTYSERLAAANEARLLATPIPQSPIN